MTILGPLILQQRTMFINISPEMLSDNLYVFSTLQLSERQMPQCHITHYCLVPATNTRTNHQHVSGTCLQTIHFRSSSLPVYIIPVSIPAPALVNARRCLVGAALNQFFATLFLAHKLVNKCKHLICSHFICPSIHRHNTASFLITAGAASDNRENAAEHAVIYARCSGKSV